MPAQSASRKPAARIIPGSSLGCRSDSNTAGTISRSAGGVRTKSDISRTRENAKERAKQAAQEQEERLVAVIREGLLSDQFRRCYIALRGSGRNCLLLRGSS